MYIILFHFYLKAHLPGVGVISIHFRVIMHSDGVLNTVALDVIVLSTERAGTAKAYEPLLPL